MEENMQLKRHKAEQGEAICWSDYSSLPFTQTMITETLRVGSIITGVMRKAMRDVEIKGYFIPKGWGVMAYFRSVHLDTHLYDKPYSFNPWRWQIVYDVIEMESFNNVKQWLNEIDRYANDSVFKLLVGNQCDLVENKVVSTETAKRTVA